MIGGVSFDPAQQPQPGQYGGRQSGPNASNAPQGVQEAIKILSLRLPRVVGPSAVSPLSLLSSPGSGGAPIDSVVNKIIQKYFPQAPQSAPQSPMAPPEKPPAPMSSGQPPVLGSDPGTTSGTMPPSSPYQAPSEAQAPQSPFPDLRRQPEIEQSPFPDLRRPRIKVDEPTPPWSTPQMPMGGSGNPWEDMTFRAPPLPPTFGYQPPVWDPGPPDPFPMI